MRNRSTTSVSCPVLLALGALAAALLPGFARVARAQSDETARQPAPASEASEEVSTIAALNSSRAIIRVGIEQGDFRGNDGRILQAAVDYVARLGGGTVVVGPGRYLLRNSLALHSNIRLVGAPGKTVLVSCDAHRSPLASSGGTNERQISVQDPSGFQIGDGVMVQDDQSMYGFSVTQATLLERLDDNTFRISRPLYHDYAPGRNARVTSAFPLVSLENVENVQIEGLTIDGNGQRMEYLTGCRGGGIFLFESHHVQIRHCTIRNYNGDAISFQTTTHVTIEDCVCDQNTGVGLHPGCGTERAQVRRTRCTNNGGDGLFLCWRVKHSVFEDNQFHDNRRHGISIGHKDSDNIFRRNSILANSLTGLFFRPDDAAGGAHRNRFDENRILDNGVPIKIEGEHHDLVFRNNVIGYSQPTEDPQPAIVADQAAQGLQAADNEFLHVLPPRNLP